LVVSRQKNHTVTQSTFDDPCRPFKVNGATAFDSGLLVYLNCILILSSEQSNIACPLPTPRQPSLLGTIPSKTRLLLGRIVGKETTVVKEWFCKSRRNICFVPRFFIIYTYLVPLTPTSLRDVASRRSRMLQRHSTEPRLPIQHLVAPHQQVLLSTPPSAVRV
jgi:hypothetical protein